MLYFHRKSLVDSAVALLRLRFSQIGGVWQLRYWRSTAVTARLFCKGL
jgi:hypothetical protein